MSSGKKIAKLLRRAANQHLWDGTESSLALRPGVDSFSCAAVMLAVYACPDYPGPVIGFLRELGVRTWATCEFSEFKPGAARQGARFLWLHFAALVAEEDGV